MASSSPYEGHCIHCGRLAELDVSTALCLDTKKCAKAASKQPEPKKDDSNGS